MEERKNKRELLDLCCAEKWILGIAMLAVGLILGASRTGRLPAPWMKGAGGVLLVAIGLYIMFKVYRKAREHEDGPGEDGR